MNERTLSITHAGPHDLEASDPRIVALVEALRSLHAVAPVERFFCERTAEVPRTFDYRIDLIDGRKWKQVLTFDVGAPLKDPLQTFEVQDTWRASEFVRHRPVRDLCVELIETAELIEIRYQFA